MKVYEAAVTGGGAAGLFAGCFLKRFGADAVILEKNPECGRKLLVTGHGRCNITNLKEPAELKCGYHEASNFVYPALKSFPPSECVRFFEEELGLRLKKEENDRMFPVTDKALDVRDSMVRYIGNDNIITGFDCVSVQKNNGVFELTSKAGEKVLARHIILACGGMSYPHTGSDGSGFKLARMLGHTIVQPKAALAVVNTAPDFCSPLAGVTVNNVVLTLFDGGIKAGESSGSLLFTHKGISGPAVMELSREIPVKPYDTYILADLAADLTDKRLVSMIDDRPKALLSTVLSEVIPQSLARALTDDPSVKCSQVTASERKKVLKRIKEFRFDIKEAPDVNSSYCTRGGVPLKELDRKTCASKITEGLYVIGENVDVDGISGGYNLAFAAASAHLAVKSIVG